MTRQWACEGLHREVNMVTVTFTRPATPAARLYLIVALTRAGLQVIVTRAVYASPQRTRPWHPVVYGATSAPMTLRFRFRQAAAMFAWDGAAA